MRGQQREGLEEQKTFFSLIHFRNLAQSLSRWNLTQSLPWWNLTQCLSRLNLAQSLSRWNGRPTCVLPCCSGCLLIFYIVCSLFKTFYRFYRQKVNNAIQNCQLPCLLVNKIPKEYICSQGQPHVNEKTLERFFLFHFCTFLLYWGICPLCLRLSVHSSFFLSQLDNIC